MTDAIDNIYRLVEIMARLRDPQAGCPWDVQQTFATIAPYTIEEAYEVADAIDRGNLDDLRDELGDLLLQVVFHARMAEERGAFAFDDVAAAISDKMVQRHPHVFGDAKVDDAAAQTVAWEAQKARERARKAGSAGTHSALEGVARALPALLRAQKLQKRAATVGFDWPDIAPVVDKVREELREVLDTRDEPSDRREEEVGDLLFACVNLARHFGVDAEGALRNANDKFERRFRRVEARIEENGTRADDLDLATLDDHWNAVKAAEKI